MPANQKAIPITIANGAALSSAALIGDHVLVGILMPAAWTAASVTFQISYDGGTSFVDLYDDGGNEVTLTPATGKYAAVSPDPFGGVTLLKMRSGTSGTPVNQAAARALTLVTRKVFPTR